MESLPDLGPIQAACCATTLSPSTLAPSQWWGSWMPWLVREGTSQGTPGSEHMCGMSAQGALSGMGQQSHQEGQNSGHCLRHRRLNKTTTKWEMCVKQDQEQPEPTPFKL